MNAVSRRICALCLLMLSMACGNERVDVGSLSGSVAPISGMDGVFLGMSQEELRRARPNAEVAGYAGFREVILGDTVIYRMPGSVNENDPPPKRSRLESVGVTFVESGDSAARSALTALSLRRREASAVHQHARGLKGFVERCSRRDGFCRPARSLSAG